MTRGRTVPHRRAAEGLDSVTDAGDMLLRSNSLAVWSLPFDKTYLPSPVCT